GDAARWLLENLDEIPLERVDLEPPALSLPNPKEESSDIIVQTCANCGRRDSSAAVGRCTGDHLVCTDCTLACATCLRTICVLCDLPSCAVCGQQVCAECLSACQRCGCGLCREHRVSC